jgi:hypothetical protein
VTVTARWPAGGSEGDEAVRAGLDAGLWVGPDRVFPVPGTARLVFEADGRERIWPTCQAAMPPVVSRATVVAMAVIVIP